MTKNNFELNQISAQSKEIFNSDLRKTTTSNIYQHVKLTTFKNFLFKAKQLYQQIQKNILLKFFKKI